MIFFFSANPDTCIVYEKKEDNTNKESKKDEKRRGVIKVRFLSTGFHYSLILSI